MGLNSARRVGTTELASSSFCFTLVGEVREQIFTSQSHLIPSDTHSKRTTGEAASSVVAQTKTAGGSPLSKSYVILRRTDAAEGRTINRSWILLLVFVLSSAWSTQAQEKKSPYPGMALWISI
jgi:hypothetical protein